MNESPNEAGCTESENSNTGHGWAARGLETENDTPDTGRTHSARVGFAETDGPRANRNSGGNLRAQVQALAERLDAQDRVIRRLGAAFAPLSNLRDHNIGQLNIPNQAQHNHTSPQHTSMSQHGQHGNHPQAHSPAQHCNRSTRPPRVNQTRNSLSNGRGAWRNDA